MAGREGADSAGPRERCGAVNVRSRCGVTGGLSARRLRRALRGLKKSPVHFLYNHSFALREFLFYFGYWLLGVALGTGVRYRIFVGPDRPSDLYTLWKICRVLRARLSRSPRDCDAGVWWQDATWLEVPGGDLLRGVPLLINGRCTDISKRRVAAAFAGAFGYGLEIDPLAYAGPAIEKSDENALHDGRVISCPIARADPAKVYQRILANEADDQHVCDIRTPIVGRSIPFVYFKYRPISRRFADFNAKVEIAETSDVFSAAEVDRILAFCGELGFDFGELDIVRDRGDGRIYILDANKTPTGPPKHLSARQQIASIFRLARSFEREFLPSPKPAVKPRFALRRRISP